MPGMMEEPGSFSGSDSSPSPERGPEPRKRGKRSGTKHHGGDDEESEPEAAAGASTPAAGASGPAGAAELFERQEAAKAAGAKAEGKAAAPKAIEPLAEEEAVDDAGVVSVEGSVPVPRGWRGGSASRSRSPAVVEKPAAVAEEAALGLTPEAGTGT